MYIRGVVVGGIVFFHLVKRDCNTSWWWRGGVVVECVYGVEKSPGGQWN